MVLTLWALLLTGLTMLAWDWWTHRPHPDNWPFDWEADGPLARCLADEQAAAEAWDRYLDAHPVLRVPNDWKETA